MGFFSCPPRSWQAESVDSGCSNSTAFAGACSEGLCGEGTCLTTGGRCDRSVGKLSTIKVKRNQQRRSEDTSSSQMSVPGFAGGEGHHDGRVVSGAGPSPAQREGGPLGSRLALHARQHHRSLADLFSWRAQPVCLQGELLAPQLGRLLAVVTVFPCCVFGTCFLYSSVVWIRKIRKCGSFWAT